MNAELIIRVVDGRLQISGPLHDELFCYGLLEKARQAVQEAATRRQSNATGPAVAVPPPGMVPGLLRRG